MVAAAPGGVVGGGVGEARIQIVARDQCDKQSGSFSSHCSVAGPADGRHLLSAAEARTNAPPPPPPPPLMSVELHHGQKQQL